MNGHALVRTFLILPLLFLSGPVDAELDKDISSLMKSSTVFVKNLASKGSGSGFVASKQNGFCYVITNAHVVEGQDQLSYDIEVDFLTGEKESRSRSAIVMAVDPMRDLALLRTKDFEKAPRVEYANDIQPGEDVYIVGFPLGEGLSSRLTQGYLTREGLTPTFTRGKFTSIIQAGNGERFLIAANAVINPGNSGGPIFNSQGQLIGVTFSKSLLEKEAFGIHYDKVLEMFDGYISYAVVEEEKSKSLVLKGVLVDPFRKIRDCDIYYKLKEESSEFPFSLNQNGKWDTINGAKSKMSFQRYHYSFEFDESHRNQSYHVQFSLRMRDQTQRHQAPFSVSLDEKLKIEDIPMYARITTDYIKGRTASTEEDDEAAANQPILERHDKTTADPVSPSTKSRVVLEIERDGKTYKTGGLVIRANGNRVLIVTPASIMALTRNHDTRMAFSSGDRKKPDKVLVLQKENGLRIPANIAFYSPDENLLFLEADLTEDFEAMEIHSTDEKLALTEKLSIWNYDDEPIGDVMVSSVRKHPLSDHFTFQIDGDLDSRVLGQPVFLDDGRLVGICHATVEDSAISFVIPRSRIAALLNGVMTVKSISLQKEKPGNLLVEGELFDPFDRVDSSFLVATYRDTRQGETISRPFRFGPLTKRQWVAEFCPNLPGITRSSQDDILSATDYHFELYHSVGGKILKQNYSRVIEMRYEIKISQSKATEDLQVKIRGEDTELSFQWKH